MKEPWAELGDINIGRHMSRIRRTISTDSQATAELKY